MRPRRENRFPTDYIPDELVLEICSYLSRPDSYPPEYKDIDNEQSLLSILPRWYAVRPRQSQK